MSQTEVDFGSETDPWVSGMVPEAMRPVGLENVRHFPHTHMQPFALRGEGCRPGPGSMVVNKS